jgi:hypothetical protein
MSEDGRAVAFHVFVEPDAGAGLDHDRRERGLADLKRIAPQIVAVQFELSRYLPNGPHEPLGTQLSGLEAISATSSTST